MKSLQEIIKPYKDRLDKTDYNNIDKDWNPNVFLFQKWAYKVGKGWYGFSIEGTPFVWAKIIDDFLEELNKVAPDFKIQQIKLKFGGLRFYVDLVDFSDSQKCTLINNEIDKLENLLFSRDLIY